MTKVQNIKNAIQFAINSDSGKKELNKSPYRDKTGKQVWRNPSMAVAMAVAIGQHKENEPVVPEFKKSKAKIVHSHPKEEYTWLKKKRK